MLKATTQKALQQIAGMTPEQALSEIAKMRFMFTHMRKERLANPLLSDWTKEYVGDYYQAKIDALNIAAAAIIDTHKIKVDKSA